MPGYSATDLFDRLRAIALPAGSYAIFGSGPLAAHGLIDEVGDLDVIVNDEAWGIIETRGTVVAYGDDRVVDLGNGLTFGRSWAPGTFDIDRLIEEAEIIDGLPFVRLDAVVSYKRIAARPKDLDHLALIDSAGDDVSPPQR